MLNSCKIYCLPQVLNLDRASENVWLNTSLLPDITNDVDYLNWDTESSDGEGNLGIPLDLIPRNVKRQLKGQEFLRRLKENLGDNEHGEV
jgi:RNA binding exosome subunit